MQATPATWRLLVDAGWQGSKTFKALKDMQIIDVTIDGSNDPATITGTATGAVTEDGTLTAGGTLDAGDVDTGENHFQIPASLAGTSTSTPLRLHQRHLCTQPNAQEQHTQAGEVQAAHHRGRTIFSRL